MEPEIRSKGSSASKRAHREPWGCQDCKHRVMQEIRGSSDHMGRAEETPEEEEEIRKGIRLVKTFSPFPVSRSRSSSSPLFHSLPAQTGERCRQEGADCTPLDSWNQTDAFLCCSLVIPDYPPLWCCQGNAVRTSDLLIMGQILQTSFSKKFLWSQWD